MGMQGPLTAQALGRSPYDDVVEGSGEEDDRQPAQQFDHRGRPINPETKRMNRDIIRSHNEVMLVIGVAEPENPYSGPEAESQRRHDAREESIGLRLASSAKRCVEAVGIFGVNGLRQRILIYKRYSQIPFWELYIQARHDFSISRDILAGAPTSLLTNFIERSAAGLWLGDKEKAVARRLVHDIWSYFKVHLQLYIALQRVGLIPNSLRLPAPSFFIPFTETSPIPLPPALEDYTLPSLAGWLGNALILTTPFLVWVMTHRMVRDWKPQIWAKIFNFLPNTIFQGKKIPQLPPPPPPPPPPPASAPPPPASSSVTPVSNESEESHRETRQDDAFSTDATVDPSSRGQPRPAATSRRASVYSTRGDDFGSDDEDNEGVSATLISFDVEPTESDNAPPGLWSAELRPSSSPDSRSNGAAPPVYLDTLLTQLPALIASHIFTDAITRALVAPYEATALRLVARMYRLRQGLSCWDIYNANMLSGITSTSLVNFLGTELLYLTLSGEVWAVFTGIAQWFHMTEEEWKEDEGKRDAGPAG